MNTILKWSDDSTIHKTLAILRADGIILASTDTVLGLCGLLNKTVCDKLNEIKQRKEKPYLVLVHDKQKLSAWVDMSALSTQVHKIIDRDWPGPLTIIFPAKKSVPDYLKSPQGTIAIRIPDHEGLRKILAHVDGLFSTSANKTGEPLACSIDQVDKDILSRVNVIIDGETYTSLPSTIIDATSGQIKIVREGACKVEL